MAIISVWFRTCLVRENDVTGSIFPFVKCCIGCGERLRMGIPDVLKLPGFIRFVRGNNMNYVTRRLQQETPQTAQHRKPSPTRPANTTPIPAAPLAMDALGSSEHISRPSEPGHEDVIAPGTYKSNFGEGSDVAVPGPAGVAEFRFPVRAPPRVYSLILISII